MSITRRYFYSFYSSSVIDHRLLLAVRQVLPSECVVGQRAVFRSCSESACHHIWLRSCVAVRELLVGTHLVLIDISLAHIYLNLCATGKHDFDMPAAAPRQRMWPSSADAACTAPRHCQHCNGEGRARARDSQPSDFQKDSAVIWCRISHVGWVRTEVICATPCLSPLITFRLWVCSMVILSSAQGAHTCMLRC